jgi:hypothetical protein
MAAAGLAIGCTVHDHDGHGSLGFFFWVRTMPLLDHFHPPLRGPRRWEGFHHSWATVIAQYLNRGLLPANYFAEPEISLGPELEVDVASLELLDPEQGGSETAVAVWSPPRPQISAKISFARLDTYEIRIYRNEGGAELRGTIELISPGNKDRVGSRQTFAAKCAGYLRHGIGVVLVDMVTTRKANLHKELFDTLEVKCPRVPWRSPTGLYAVAYRAVTSRKAPHVEAWPESLAVGKKLPTMPLWLTPEFCVPVQLEETYLATCESLRISA